MTTAEYEESPEFSRNLTRVHRTSLGAHIAALLLLLVGLSWLVIRFTTCQDSSSWECQQSFALPLILFTLLLLLFGLQASVVHGHGRARLTVKANALKLAASPSGTGESALPPPSYRKAMVEGYLNLPAEHQAKVRRTVALTILGSAGVLAASILTLDDHPEVPNAIVLIVGVTLSFASIWALRSMAHNN